MTSFLNNFEGGTNGTTISNANSGGTSGNAFNVIGSGTGTTEAYSSSFAAHGTLSGKMQVGTTSAPAYISWNSTTLGTVSAISYGRAYIYLSAAPGTGDAVIAFLNGSTFGGGIQINTSRKIILQNSASGFDQTFTTTLALSTWYRIEWSVTPGSSGTGTLVCNLYVGDSGTVTETKTGTGGYVPSNWNAIRFGWGAAGTSHASQPALYFDDVGFSTTGFLGVASTTWTLASATTGTTSTTGALGWTATLASAVTDSSSTTGTLAWQAPISGTAASASVTAGDVYRSGGLTSPLLTSAQAVATGAAASTLAVPAQAGVQAGDLILIWAATGG